MFSSQVLTKEKEEEIKDKVLEEIDDKIHEIPDLPKLELGDGLANILGAEAEDILKENFVNSKRLDDEALENTKEEYDFEEIKMRLQSQNNSNFSMVVTMKNLFKYITFCHLTNTTMNLFLSFAQTMDKIS